MDKNKSLYFSFIDGIFASIMTGFTMNYVIPFGLVLGAKNFQIGLLNALPQFFGSLIQLLTADFVEKLKSRLRIISIFVYFHGLSFFLVLLLLFNNFNKADLFIFITTLSTVLTSVAGPAWWSLMSDTVDKEKYGEYFAWRGKVLGVVSLISSFIAGFFLGIMQDKFVAFVILFSLSGLMRIISGYFISKMEDIPFEINKEKRFNYIDFVKRYKESNLVKYVIFISLFNFAVAISSPFFSVYMLKDLRLSYYEYTVVTLSTSITTLLFLPFWGRMADKIGNVRIIKITGFFICFVPILWIFSENVFYLIFINAIAGYLWAAFNLSTVNFIFDAASQEVRTRCISYFGFTNGMFVFLGNLLSGWFATHLPSLVKGSKLLTLFLLSGILRLFFVILFKDKFKEVKSVEEIDRKQLLFIVLGIKPVLDFGKEIIYPTYLKKSK
ncbi:MAG: MFS transporter [Endomicrobia bacterium]|nr:MFS transporter [Endomicrobiia bacterium]